MRARCESALPAGDPQDLQHRAMPSPSIVYLDETGYSQYDIEQLTQWLDDHELSGKNTVIGKGKRLIVHDGCPVGLSKAPFSPHGPTEKTPTIVARSAPNP